MGVAVFDVCDTLYFSNTTHDFVSFVVSVGGRGKIRHAVLNSKYLPFRYALIAISRYIGRDPLRSYNVGMLRGYSSEELQALARRFVKEYLRERRIDVVHEMMEESTALGRRIVLCSTSIEPVVAAIAEDLQVQTIICSRLDHAKGICTGTIVDDVGAFKLDRVRALGVLDEIDVAVSDNLDDLDLLKAARQGIAVVHTDRKESFWRSQGVETIRPDR